MSALTWELYAVVEAAPSGQKYWPKLEAQSKDCVRVFEHADYSQPWWCVAMALYGSPTMRGLIEPADLRALEALAVKLQRSFAAMVDKQPPMSRLINRLCEEGTI